MSRSPVPPRILFVANDPPGRAVYRYRCENFADILRGAGWSADVVYVGDRHVRVDHDIVALHRICANAEGRAYGRAARACGATLVYGADDLVFDSPTELSASPSYADKRRRHYAALHARMARDADAVLVSTEFLAQRARALTGGTKPVRVVRNFLSRELLEISDRAALSRPQRESGPPRRVTLGYLSGTPTHDADLASIAGPLADALRAFPNAELLLVGPVQLPSGFTSGLPPVRIRRAPFVPWRDLPGILATVDINLAPLDLANVFNHAKSAIKLLEAGAVGVPTVASATAGFREAVAGSPPAGFLAADADDWRRLLSELLGSVEARRVAGDAARAFVRSTGAADACRDTVRETFDQLLELPRPRPVHPAATHVGSWFAPKHLAKSVLRRLGR